MRKKMKSMETDMNAAVAAAMWLGKARASIRMGSNSVKRAARRRSTMSNHATC
jgi:hypothetical protein